MLKKRIVFRLKLLSRTLSFRAACYAVGAVASALIAIAFASVVPDSLAEVVGGDAVTHILTILATSMLAVVTFSLSTLVASYASIAGSAPPRATALIIEDSRAHSALSTFLGAFIYSIVSLVALSSKYYGPKGRVILFVITIGILVAVIWTIIRWIGQLSELGKLGHVMNQIEGASEKSLVRSGIPFEWNHRSPKSAPADSFEVVSPHCGFVQSIDFDTLTGLSQSEGLEIFIEMNPGELITPGTVVARVYPTEFDSCIADEIQSCFILGNGRTFDEDPRFALIVLSEVASRALSPAINDPGTAIYVLGSLVRLLIAAKNAESEVEPDTRVHVKPIRTEQVFEDAFGAIARDGASNVEVSIFLERCLVSLSRFPEFAAAAQAQSKDHLARVKLAMAHAPDRALVESASRR